MSATIFAQTHFSNRHQKEWLAARLACASRMYKGTSALGLGKTVGLQDAVELGGVLEYTTDRPIQIL